MRANCSTCYELLACSEDLVCLPCGHVFHYHCTVQWFQSKKNCPQCRHPANEKNARKIFFSEADELDTDKSPEDLQQQIDNLQLQVRIGKCDLENLKEENKKIKENNKKLVEEVKEVEKSKRDAEAKAKSHSSRIKCLLEDREKYTLMQIEYEQVKNKLAKFSLLEKTLEGSIGDVNAILHERGSFTSESRDLATLVVELKKKLSETKKTKALQEREISEFAASRAEDKKKIKTLSIKVSELEDKMTRLTSSHELKLEELEDENRNLKLANDRLSRRRAFDVEKEKENRLSDNFRLDNSEIEDEDLSQDLTYMESPKVAYKSVAISAGEKRKACSQLVNLEPARVSSQSSGSSQTNGCKRSKFQNLLEIGSLDYKDGKGYDGFGGRSRPDIFPDPLLIKRPSVGKKPCLSKTIKKGNGLTRLEKNQQTVDRFFGKFDTP